MAIDCKWLMMSPGLDPACEDYPDMNSREKSLLESVRSWIEQVRPWLAEASHGRGVSLLLVQQMLSEHQRYASNCSRCWCCWEQARQSPCFPLLDFHSTGRGSGPLNAPDKCIEEHKLVYVMERDCRWGWPMWFRCHRSQKVCLGKDIELRPDHQRWATTQSLEAEGSTELGR